MKNLVVLIGVLVLTMPAIAQSLTVSDYVGQVSNSHQGYQSSVIQAEAAGKKRNESSLEYSLYLFGDANHLNDQSPRTSTLLQGDRSQTDSYSIGFSKKTRFGLASKLYYNVNHSEISGLPPTLGSPSDYYSNSFNLELSQSLLKNGFGRASQAREESAIAQQDAIKASAQFNALSIISDAEVKYWNLALAQEILTTRKDAFERSEDIVKYNQRRRRRHLIEASESIQAEAALESRRLELQTAENSLVDAAVNFNLARGVDSDAVSEKVEAPELKDILTLTVPERLTIRLDTLAAKRLADANVALAKAGQEGSKADLEIYGKAATGGLNPAFSEAYSDSVSTENPTTQIGIRLSIPLDRSVVNSVQNGYRLDAKSAQLTYSRKLQEQEVNWKNLVRSFEERKKRLQVAIEAERLQLKKLKNEKNSRSAGRSTTYQVLLFEQDYLNSQAAKFQLMLEAVNIHSQLKTFGGPSELR